MATAAAAAARRLPLLLGASSTLLYLLFPFVGDRGWDALMTASVLARPEGAGAVEILFFAHPLVIPLTWPFAWLTDPLLATSLRESVAAGVVVGLSARLLLGLGASRLGAMLGALLLTFASGRWVLATSGEEKETAMAFGGLF
ncbi:MAG: hypothetical protein OEY14_12720, partial [Myxococcales bacterium]|nr:hypothetical protein [Myxococcales bacterium]